ncbi:hypothetical protein DKX38_018828 [Salix brachista]|uniref:Uncharacterized protein n=1 Tax=Salix brachista TaxID=2182728 RepID=A0A5N5KPW3_9ROSI|nr:hypothetical protein DKX38_018828 [Salix brachista]
MLTAMFINTPTMCDVNGYTSNYVHIKLYVDIPTATPKATLTTISDAGDRPYHHMSTSILTARQCTSRESNPGLYRGRSLYEVDPITLGRAIFHQPKLRLLLKFYCSLSHLFPVCIRH